MLAVINLSVRGLPCGPPNRSSAVCICRLARIAAMIPMTRLRPSSTSLSLSLSPCIRLCWSAMFLVESRDNPRGVFQQLRTVLVGARISSIQRHVRHFLPIQTKLGDESYRTAEYPTRDDCSTVFAFARV